MNLLEDELIRLRAPEPEDLEVMYEMENMPELWEVGCTTQPYSRHLLRQYLEQSANDLYAERQLRLVVTAKADSQVLGMADLTAFDPLHGRAEVGMAVRAGYRQKGVGRRALTLLCRYAFGFLHLHQLYACIPADNEGSLRMFVGCGFMRQAVLKEWLSADSQTAVGYGATYYKDAVLVQRINEEKV